MQFCIGPHSSRLGPCVTSRKQVEHPCVIIYIKPPPQPQGPQSILYIWTKRSLLNTPTNGNSSHWGIWAKVRDFSQTAIAVGQALKPGGGEGVLVHLPQHLSPSEVCCEDTAASQEADMQACWCSAGSPHPFLIWPGTPAPGMVLSTFGQGGSSLFR